MAEERKSRFRTKIDGNTYTIVGPKSQKHMKTVADLVSEQLDSLKSITNGLDSEKRAVLLAINTVSEQVELQKKVIELEEKIESLENNKVESNQSENS